MKLVYFLLFLTGLFALAAGSANAQGRANPRIVVLIICDGLRPDFVTQREMPRLYELEREGVRFDRQHAEYPTVTMVNAATLATGAPPGITGILGDFLYLGPALAQRGADLSQEPLKKFSEAPVDLENTGTLEALNAPGAFAGTLLGLDTVAQEVETESGFIAVVGKRGPTLLFDPRVDTVADGRDSQRQPHANYMFLADDGAFPASLDDTLKSLPPQSREGVSDRERDRAFSRFVGDRAIPAARQAMDSGHPAMITLWLHNADITQHLAGLGTFSAMQALTECDQNIMTVRAAISAAGLENRTDVIVVSDHGFATIRERVWLAALLVSAGLKKAIDSDDVIVAPNGGSDLVYLSSSEFRGREALRERLQKVVDFCEAQEWCGPIFSREPAIVAPVSHKHSRKQKAEPVYKGWIDGTFAQSALGLLSQARSPDLIISFQESPNEDNKGLTGPNNPAFGLGSKGQQSVQNKSQQLVHPVKGVVYSDLGQIELFTTGMGMHGAAGSREIHNFAAAIGPEFKRGFIDQNPTGNIDIAPTIARLLGLLPKVGPGSIAPTGRVLTEALKGQSSYVGGAHAITMKTDLELQGVRAITTLHATRLADRLYLDDSSAEREPLGSSP
jgi:arylsulfatase A-like enzyme